MPPISDKAWSILTAPLGIPKVTEINCRQNSCSLKNSEMRSQLCTPSISDWIFRLYWRFLYEATFYFPRRDWLGHNFFLSGQTKDWVINVSSSCEVRMIFRFLCLKWGSYPSHGLPYSVVVRLRKDHTKICKWDLERNGIIICDVLGFTQRVLLKAGLPLSQDGSTVTGSLLQGCKDVSKHREGPRGQHLEAEKSAGTRGKAPQTRPHSSLAPHHCLQGTGQRNTAGGGQATLSTATIGFGQRKMYAQERGRARDLWL